MSQARVDHLLFITIATTKNNNPLLHISSIITSGSRDYNVITCFQLLAKYHGELQYLLDPVQADISLHHLHYSGGLFLIPLNQMQSRRGLDNMTDLTRLQVE